MITVLCGGTGAAKFLQGLVRVADPASIATIINTGDDLTWWGLHVSPDIDSVLYALAGLLSNTPERNWGFTGDTFDCLARMKALGMPAWFSLGDRDLATHLFRTQRLQQGATLRDICAEMAVKLGIRTRILPMTDDRVETRVLTDRGELGFQEFFVRERHAVPAKSVRFAGAESARPAPAVYEAIMQSDAIIVAPSNPITSIGPILAVPGIRAALVATKARVIAISPIVGGSAVSGPAAELMRVQGLPVSALGVAQCYQDFLDTLVIDHQDAALAPALGKLGIASHVCNTLISDDAAKEALARAVMSQIARSSTA